MFTSARLAAVLFLSPDHLIVWNSLLDDLRDSATEHFRRHLITKIYSLNFTKRSRITVAVFYVTTRYKSTFSEVTYIYIGLLIYLSFHTQIGLLINSSGRVTHCAALFT